MKKELKDCMTSELLHQALNPETDEKDKAIYLGEYKRRLKMMNLSDEQIESFRKADETAIKNGCYIKSDVLLATKPFITESMNENSIKTENCTFSELVYLIHDATTTYSSTHSWWPTEPWDLVCKHAFYCGKRESAIENRDRMVSIGITPQQEAIFVKNESKIAKRLRWNVPTTTAWA